MSEPERCRWRAETDLWGTVWWEACEESSSGFVFEEGGPRENAFRYCPFCGREIEVRPEDEA